MSIIIAVFVLIAPKLAMAQGAGGGSQVQHSQSMHVYIAQQAYKLLENEAPAEAEKLRKHMGTGIGTVPWNFKTIITGAYREDEEDVVYGHGGPREDLHPSVRLTGGDASIAGELLKEAKNEPMYSNALSTVSHFWDRFSSSNTIVKIGEQSPGIEFPVPMIVPFGLDS